MRAAGRHPAAGGSTRVPLGWLLLLAWLGSGVTIFLGEASRGGRPDQKGPWLQRRAGLETLTATAVGGGSGGARPGAFSVPTQQPAARPEHKFLMFFSGHQVLQLQ